MKQNHLKNPLKEIEQQTDRILFQKKEELNKEINKSTNDYKYFLIDIKKQLINLVKELKQKHLNLVA